MRNLGFQNRNTSTQVSESIVGMITESLDRMRITFLRLTMKSLVIRQIYSDRATRLGFSFVVFSLIYLILALKLPLMLLVLGPMVLGYPHLIASYRFLQNSVKDLRWTVRTRFKIFVWLTLVSLLIRYVFPNFIELPSLPYGSWELGLAFFAVLLLKLKLNSVRDFFVVLLTILLTLGVFSLAWQEPLAFVGFALILHNWVGFGHWYKATQDQKNRRTVLFCLAVFIFVHIVVLLGFCDAWISTANISFFSTQSFEIKGWALAPWSSSPLVWNRMIVIYTFGLSMHYFVWLQAIPQCLDLNSAPNSFRRSFEKWRSDCGPMMILILSIGALALLGLWLFTSLAGRFYFGLALLHGWLELSFLIVTVSTSLGFFIKKSKP